MSVLPDAGPLSAASAGPPACVAPSPLADALAARYVADQGHAVTDAPVLGDAARRGAILADAARTELTTDVAPVASGDTVVLGPRLAVDVLPVLDGGPATPGVGAARPSAPRVPDAPTPPARSTGPGAVSVPVTSEPHGPAPLQLAPAVRLSARPAPDVLPGRDLPPAAPAAASPSDLDPGTAAAGEPFGDLLPSQPGLEPELDVATSIALLLATGQAWEPDPLPAAPAVAEPAVAAPAASGQVPPAPAVLPEEPPWGPPVEAAPVTVPAAATWAPAAQPEWQPAPQPVPLVPEQVRRRVELGFRDGSSTALDPDSEQALALAELSQLLTGRN